MERKILYKKIKYWRATGWRYQKTLKRVHGIHRFGWKIGRAKKKHKKKREFATKKKALEWEHSMQLASKTDMNIKLADFVDIYFRDKEGELKQRTVRNKKYMIEQHIIPTLGNKALDHVIQSDIIQWQNSIRNLGFKETYNRMLQNQLTALFNHAARIYGLKDNPCAKVKRMGKSDADKK